jgi:hypothetical protein
MADQSIPQLPVATPLTGQELTVVVQNGVTKQTQVQDINFIEGYARITTTNGIPVQVPPTVNGTAAMAFDATNNNLYIYSNGLWRRFQPS